MTCSVNRIGDQLLRDYGFRVVRAYKGILRVWGFRASAFIKDLGFCFWAEYFEVQEPTLLLFNGVP